VAFFCQKIITDQRVINKVKAALSSSLLRFSFALHFVSWIRQSRQFIETEEKLIEPKHVISQMLRQWGVDADFAADPVSAALATKQHQGSGCLIVSLHGKDSFAQNYPSMFEAANCVINAVANLLVEAIVNNDPRYVSHLRPEMFQWVPRKRDVVTTPDADVVIAKIKESM
jgi:hypothetical protein